MANLYEEQYDMYDVGKRRYSDATADAPAPAPLPPRPISTTPKVGVQDAVGEKKWRSFIISMVLHGITIALLAAILTIILTTGQQTNTSTEPTAQSSKIQAAPKNGTSCLDLANKGNNKDNIYKITPQATNVEEFQAYCDMTTDGGGWTLVASIRDTSITQKCSPDDLWSSYFSLDAKYDIETNWENEMVFGYVDRCTNQDYKNPGYYNIKAKDIMVWHVPGDTTIAKIKQESTFQYRTNNSFLNARSLKGLFQEYPLKPSSGHLQGHRLRAQNRYIRHQLPLRQHHF